jgi:hypothetical protein
VSCDYEHGIFFTHKHAVYVPLYVYMYHMYICTFDIYYIRTKEGESVVILANLVISMVDI